MSGRLHLRSGRTLAALGTVLVLLALAAHPATAAAVVGMVLLPVALFGCVLVPLSLEAIEDPEARVTRPILVRARLFQRPPPISLR